LGSEVEVIMISAYSSSSVDFAVRLLGTMTFVNPISTIASVTKASQLSSIIIVTHVENIRKCFDNPTSLLYVHMSRYNMYVGPSPDNKI